MFVLAFVFIISYLPICATSEIYINVSDISEASVPYDGCRYSNGVPYSKTIVSGYFVLKVTANNNDSSDVNVSLRAYLDDLYDGENGSEISAMTFDPLNGVWQGLLQDTGTSAVEYNLTVPAGGSNQTQNWHVERPIYDSQYRIIVVPDNNWSKNDTTYFNLTCVNSSKLWNLSSYYGTVENNSVSACNEPFHVVGSITYTAKRNFTITLNYTLSDGTTFYLQNHTIAASSTVATVNLESLTDQSFGNLSGKSDGTYEILVGFDVWSHNNTVKNFSLTDWDKSDNNGTTNSLFQRCNIDVSLEGLSINRNETCRCSISITVNACNLNPYDVFNETIVVNLTNGVNNSVICTPGQFDMNWNKNNWEGPSPTNKTCYQQSFSCSIPDNASDGSYNLSVGIDPDNNITYKGFTGGSYSYLTSYDVNRSNNVLKIPININCTVDLNITNAYVTNAPDAVYMCMNETRNITVEACMYGMHSGLTVPIAFYLDGVFNQTKNATFSPDCVHITQNTTVNCSTILFEFTMPDGEGITHNLTFSIDPDNNESEWSETNNNNTLQLTAQCMDIRLNSLQLIPNTTFIGDDNQNANRFYNWTAEICDIGPNATNVRVDFYYVGQSYSGSCGGSCTDSYIQCANRNVQTLFINISSNNCTNVTGNVPHSIKREDNYTVYVIANPQKIGESNYTNNGFPINESACTCIETNCSCGYSHFGYCPLSEYPAYSKAAYEVKYSFDLTPSFHGIIDYGYTLTTLGGSDYNFPERGVCYSEEYNVSIHTNRSQSEREAINLEMNVTWPAGSMLYLTNISRCQPNCCCSPQYNETIFSFTPLQSEQNSTQNFTANVDQSNAFAEYNETNNIVNYSYFVYPDIQNRGSGSICCIDVEIIGDSYFVCRGARNTEDCPPGENITVYTTLRSWNKGTGQATLVYYTALQNGTRILSHVKTFDITNDTYPITVNQSFAPNVSLGDNYTIDIIAIDSYFPNMSDCVNISLDCRFNVTDAVPSCVDPLAQDRSVRTGNPLSNNKNVAPPTGKITAEIGDIAVSYDKMLGKEIWRYGGINECNSTNKEAISIYDFLSSYDGCIVRTDSGVYNTSITSVLGGGLTLKGGTLIMNEKGVNLDDAAYYSLNYFRYNNGGTGGSFGYSPSSVLGGCNYAWNRTLVLDIIKPPNACTRCSDYGIQNIHTFNCPNFKTLSPGFINIKGTSSPMYLDGSNNVNYTWQVVYPNGTNITICRRDIILGIGTNNITGIPLPIVIYNIANVTNVTYDNSTGDQIINVNGTVYNLTQYDPDLCVFDYTGGNINCPPHWRLVLDAVPNESNTANNVLDTDASNPGCAPNSDNIFIGTFTSSYANPYIASVIWPQKLCNETGSTQTIKVTVCNGGLDLIGTEKAWNIPVYLLLKNSSQQCCTVCGNAPGCVDCSNTSLWVDVPKSITLEPKGSPDSCQMLSFVMDGSRFSLGENVSLSTVIDPLRASPFDSYRTDDEDSYDSGVQITCEGRDIEMRSASLYPSKVCTNSSLYGIADVYYTGGSNTLGGVKLRAQTSNTTDNISEYAPLNTYTLYEGTVVALELLDSALFKSPDNSGNYTMNFFVDPDNSIVEDNELNNNLTRSFTALTCNNNLMAHGYTVPDADACSTNKTFCPGNRSIIVHILNKGNSKTGNVSLYINGNLVETMVGVAFAQSIGNYSRTDLTFYHVFDSAASYSVSYNVSLSVSDDNPEDQEGFGPNITVINCSDGADLRITGVDVPATPSSCIYNLNAHIQNRGALNVTNAWVQLLENNLVYSTTTTNISGYENKTIQIVWTVAPNTPANISFAVFSGSSELDETNNRYPCEGSIGITCTQGSPKNKKPEIEHTVSPSELCSSQNICIDITNTAADVYVNVDSTSAGTTKNARLCFTASRGSHNILLSSEGFQPTSFDISVGGCGDGKCNCGENCSCSDCACKSTEICCGGACKTPLCSANSNCGDSNICTNDSCMYPGTCDAYCLYTPIVPCCNNGICESSAGENCSNCADCNCVPPKICCEGACRAPLCLMDSQCDDTNICTTDSCQNPNKCNASCSYKNLSPCCGNGYCESGENCNNCTDCSCGLGQVCTQNQCICVKDTCNSSCVNGGWEWGACENNTCYCFRIVPPNPDDPEPGVRIELNLPIPQSLAINISGGWEIIRLSDNVLWIPINRSGDYILTLRLGDEEWKKLITPNGIKEYVPTIILPREEIPWWMWFLIPLILIIPTIFLVYGYLTGKKPVAVTSEMLDKLGSLGKAEVFLPEGIYLRGSDDVKAKIKNLVESGRITLVKLDDKHSGISKETEETFGISRDDAESIALAKQHNFIFMTTKKELADIAAKGGIKFAISKEK